MLRVKFSFMSQHLGTGFCPYSPDVKCVFHFSLTLSILNAIINLLTTCVSLSLETKGKEGVGEPCLNNTNEFSSPWGPILLWFYIQR